MDKKRLFGAIACINIFIALIIGGFLWVGTNCVCLADDNNQKFRNAIVEEERYTPPAGRIFSVNDATFEFIPPKGWERTQIAYTGPAEAPICFANHDFGMAILYIDIFPLSENAMSQGLENMLKSQLSQPNNSDGHLIKFRNMDAITWLTKINGVKTKHIIAFDNTAGVSVLFYAYEKDFDMLLPDVEKSLESFKVVSIGYYNIRL